MKHKTKILVTNGWVNPYRFFVTDENGETKPRYGDDFFISEFEVLEEGVDEEPKPRDWKKKNEEEVDGFNISFDDNDDLPF